MYYNQLCKKIKNLGGRSTKQLIVGDGGKISPHTINSGLALRKNTLKLPVSLTINIYSVLAVTIIRNQTDYIIRTADKYPCL